MGGKTVIYNNFQCDICGKPRVRNNHVKCSRIRQKRRQAEDRAKQQKVEKA